MKLTKKIKKQIDNYFEKISPEKLYRLSINKYNFKEVNRMKLDDVIKHIKLQEQNLEFWKKRSEKLEAQIENMKCISDVVTDIDLELDRNSYTKDEIVVAYNRAIKYEGLGDRTGGLIVDTIIDFLNGTHHSLKKK